MSDAPIQEDPLLAILQNPTRTSSQERYVVQCLTEIFSSEKSQNVQLSTSICPTKSLTGIVMISVSTSTYQTSICPTEAAIANDEEFDNSYLSVELQNDSDEWLALQVERGLIIELFKCYEFLIAVLFIFHYIFFEQYVLI